MDYNERCLFKALCCFKSQDFDIKQLQYTSATVLGHIFFNRMQAVAYGNMYKKGILQKANREFRNPLKTAYEYNLQKNISYLYCVQWLNDLLSSFECEFAMLKGALLCSMYPDGYRTSNDIDLLVSPKNVSKIGYVLSREGFQQGYIRDETFVGATRQEIITSKMTRGETVPYIKQVDLPNLKYLEVDINFSLDYKSGNEYALDEMLNQAKTVSTDRITIQTLTAEDFFIHLCCHLYKEATTLPWIQMKRDMSLYKYCDIYLLLSDMSVERTKKLYDRATSLGFEKVCAFSILQTAALFDVTNEFAISNAQAMLTDDPDFIHTIIDPRGKRLLRFSEKDITERFFSADRQIMLKEVNSDE